METFEYSESSFFVKGMGHVAGGERIERTIIQGEYVWIQSSTAAEFLSSVLDCVFLTK